MRLSKFLITLFAFFCFLSGVSPASAKPISVISDNFEFYGDASEKEATEFIESLEAYRAILFAVYKFDPGPEFLPVKIYGFKSQSRIEKLTGRDNIGGLYSTTLEGPAFLLTTEGGLKRGKPALRIAYHEYTHHVLSGFTDKVYPLWYNEGYADYLSTFDYDKHKGRFKIGLPNKGRARALVQKNWLPYDVVLGSIRRYPFKNQGEKSNDTLRNLFYAQSWLATHYLQSTEGFSEKLNTYINMLNEPNAPPNAFEIAMGMSVEEFEKNVRAYRKKNRYSYKIITLSKSVKIPTVQSRKLSKAELKYHYGEALRIMIRTNDGRKLARDYFNEAEEDLGATVQILTSKALLELTENDLEKASILAKKALRIAPDSRHVQRTMGIVELQNAKRLGNEHGSVKSARKHLISAMKAYPDDVTAHYYYAQSFADGYEKPSKQALSSANSALNYYRSLNFMHSNLEMAKILEKGGKDELSLPAYKRIETWARISFLRKYAKQKREAIEAKN